MITKYISEIIRVFVKSELISAEEMQNLLMLDGKRMAALLENESDDQLQIENIECFSNAFGMDAFDNTFLTQVLAKEYRGTSSHSCLASQNSEIGTGISKLWAIHANGSTELRESLARLAANKSYLMSCQMMLDSLKEAGVMEAAEEVEEVEDAEKPESCYV
jgi:hypothetical protein